MKRDEKCLASVHGGIVFEIQTEMRTTTNRKGFLRKVGVGGNLKVNGSYGDKYLTFSRVMLLWLESEGPDRTGPDRFLLSLFQPVRVLNHHSESILCDKIDNIFEMSVL